LASPDLNIVADFQLSRQ